MHLICLEHDVSKDVYFYVEGSTPQLQFIFAYSRKAQQLYFCQLLDSHMAKIQLHKCFK